MENNHLSFGEYVKQRRESLSITSKDFAAKVEISPAYLCDIEKGNRRPPEKYLEKLLTNKRKCGRIIQGEDERMEYNLNDIVDRAQKHSDCYYYNDDNNIYSKLQLNIKSLTQIYKIRNNIQ